METRCGSVVSDTGAGMDAEALARAFEPYFSTKATGTGLGLTIAKRNVELNGGTICRDQRERPGNDGGIAIAGSRAGQCVFSVNDRRRRRKRRWLPDGFHRTRPRPSGAAATGR